MSKYRNMLSGVNHMILACQNISKAFGTTEIIKNASFSYRRTRKSRTGRHQRCRKIDAVKKSSSAK